ncbi:hypothetical protein B14911_23172 [Bacillus sp. NRRL B-14911]|uniref:Uncharacterized protein n=1 Tax=Bacillus infantis NRRL B-14911 TaxID=1367477 RepID=U5LCA6_9BACI|nr:hypothetical protein N288_15835 [Bacillus infantis NRRL B-14911]EAR66508.1 hypothetical protein B14911_23172 [Bacillus sp. NRRL B-14911]OXT14771.1 hypothetical protein B9K06_24590 [Bacillus sp. OG2]PLR72048.1 hypothetical protein CYJ37_10790 [Bacillus sp. UMB0728]
MNGMHLFIALVFFSIILIIISFRKEIRVSLPLYFFVMGLSFILEYIVFILGKAYTYRPTVFEEKWFDEVFGASISQALFIPAVLTAVSIYRIGYLWRLAVIAGIFLVESFFLKEGVYEQHWWRSWYTSAILFAAMFVTDIWRDSLRKPSPFVRFVTIYMAITTIIQAAVFYTVIFFRIHTYNAGFFESHDRDQLAFSTLIWLIYSLILAVIVIYEFRKTVFAGLFAGAWLFEKLLIQAGVLTISHLWSSVYSAALITLFCFLIGKLAVYFFPDIKGESV